MWPERVPQKVETLLARLLDAGLRLIQSESQPRGHLSRPIQCLCRFSATEDHEIVRVGHHPGLELLPPFGIPPALQQTVHVQIGKHGTDNTTLGSPAVVVLPTCQPTFPVLVAFLSRDRKPHLDQMQHLPIDDSTSDTL